LRSVSILGLFNEFDYELTLNPDLTFVHAPNGCGKSILMHMIYSLLRGDISYLEETPFRRMDVRFTDDSVLIVENVNGRLVTQMQKSELEMPVTPEEIENLADIVLVPPDRLTMKKKDGHIVDTLEYISQEMYDTIRLAKEDKELSIDSTSDVCNMNDSELEFYCKDLKAKLDFIKDAGFEPDMPSGTRFPPSRYDLMDNRKQYEALASGIADYIDRNYQLAESIIVYKDIVNNIFLNKSIDVTEAGKLIICMNNGTTLPLNKLSSGETQTLILFYLVLFHSATGGIVIIDEPENSLHVSWQQMLGDYFSDISRVRGVQMIVATHSPQVIHDKWDYSQELVQKNA